jgi:preprotein translocase subunit SecA
MRLFNAGMVERVMNTAGLADDMCRSSPRWCRARSSPRRPRSRRRTTRSARTSSSTTTSSTASAQVIYDERRRVLEGEDLQEQLRHFVNDVVEGYVDAETAEGYPEDWDLDRLWTALRTLYPDLGHARASSPTRPGASPGSLARASRRRSSPTPTTRTTQREAALGEEVMREVERRVMLSVLDRKWREHLYEMDYLQEGIGLRAMAQRDPLVEYQRGGLPALAGDERVRQVRRPWAALPRRGPGRGSPGRAPARARLRHALGSGRCSRRGVRDGQ